MFFYSKVWFCLATQEGNPSILVFDVITLDAEGGGIGKLFLFIFVFEDLNCKVTKNQA